MEISVGVEYTGAYEAKFVNRREILDDIRQAIQERGGTRVFYITAPGGMGKTRLCRHVLRQCHPGDDEHLQGEWARPADLLPATEVVDFYHTQTHSLEGLARAIRAVLRPGLGYFGHYDRALERFKERKHDLGGMLGELSTLRTAVGAAFIEDINRVARGRRLVLALDTAEKLLYETDEIQEALGLRKESVAVLPWLLHELLRDLQNAVVLIAGRPDEPQHSRLRQDLRSVLEEKLDERTLDAFELEDAIEYFDAVAQNAWTRGREEMAERIGAIDRNAREVVWHYTEGRPILLSLTIDYLIVGDRLLPEVKVPVEEARCKTPEELKEIEARIEGDLIRVLQDTGRPADEAIRSLGWARKGMDAELLARVMKLRKEDNGKENNTWDVEQAQGLLDSLRDLSFVKIRPSDRRVFLHDEMYNLLQRHVLTRLPDARRERVFTTLREYYADKIEQARGKAEEFQRRLGDEMLGSGDVAKALSETMSRLHAFMVEDVYYRLRGIPVDGFQTGYNYRKEAFWSAGEAESLDMGLRSEMLAYLTEGMGTEQFDGLSRSDIVVDLGLGWIERLLSQAEWDAARVTARHFRSICADLLKQGGILAEVQLDSLEGYALASLGDELDQAEELLKSAVSTLQTYRPETEFQTWMRDGILADALNSLGYLYRVLGRFRQAVATYERAVGLWWQLRKPARTQYGRSSESEEEPKVAPLRRVLDRVRHVFRSRTMKRLSELGHMAAPPQDLYMPVQYSNALNNLSWAYAEMGEFDNAERYCRDALAIRQALGSRGLVAFSLNAMGQIQVRNDRPLRARRNCRQALVIFRDLEYPRGVGMASRALAEALRYANLVTPPLYKLEEQVQSFKQARDLAGEAVRIFRTEVPERPRLIESLIELGCVYREWVRTDYRPSDLDPARRTLVQNGKEAFRDAIREGEAEEEFLYLVVEAQVNLAWLHYYVGEIKQALEELESVMRRVPREYHITSEDGLPSKDLPLTFYWAQMGEACLLRGQMFMDEFRESQKLDALENAVRWYTLSLAYNELYASLSRDIRHGLERIYDNLKELNVREEFPAVRRAVDEAAREYHLPKRTRMHEFLDDSFSWMKAV